MEKIEKKKILNPNPQMKKNQLILPIYTKIKHYLTTTLLMDPPTIDPTKLSALVPPGM